MTETEARQILGVAEKSTWEEVLQVGLILTFPFYNAYARILRSAFHSFCRSTTTCLSKMQRTGASIFNRKSIEQKNVQNQFTKVKQREQIKSCSHTQILWWCSQIWLFVSPISSFTLFLGISLPMQMPIVETITKTVYCGQRCQLVKITYSSCRITQI